jgi:hypothetical protein
MHFFILGHHFPKGVFMTIANQDHENKSQTTTGFPLGTRMTELFLDQMADAAELLPPMVTDVQKIFLSGARLGFKAGKVLENRFKNAPKIVSGMETIFDKSAPTILNIQSKFADIFVQSTHDGIRLIKKVVKGGL